MQALSNSSQRLNIYSLKGDYAFRRLRKGQAGFAKHVGIRWLAHQEGCVYVGIIVNKKVGNAVTRNLVRRRLREALRALLQKRKLNAHALFEQKPSFRMVIIAKPEAAQADYWQLKNSLARALERGKLLT